MTRAPALLCTDHVADRYADRLAAAAPGWELVPLVGESPVEESELARVDAAFLSADSFPGRTRHVLFTVLAAPNLRWLHTFSAGIDHPIFGQFSDKGVRITTSSGAAAAPIARTIMLYLLGLSRDIRGVLDDQAAHRWNPRPFDDLDGRTIGVIGMGPIARETIRMAAALGMNPIGMRRAVLGDEPCETWTLDRLPELAATADVLAVALPLTDDTRGIVSAAVIAAMKPGAGVRERWPRRPGRRARADRRVEVGPAVVGGARRVRHRAPPGRQPDLGPPERHRDAAQLGPHTGLGRERGRDLLRQLGPLRPR